MRLLHICIALTLVCVWLLSAAAHPLGTLAPFAPTGHFETAFLPLGELHASKDGVLYKFDPYQLFRSTDDGAMWEALPPTDAEEIALILSPDFDRDGKLFAGVWDDFDAVRLSSDGGYTWRSPQQPVAGRIGGFAISPSFAADQTLYVHGWSPPALRRSVDGGEHWQAANLPNGGSTVWQLILSPNFLRDQTLIALADGMWRSFDGGLTWSAADGDLKSAFADPYAVAAAPLDSETIALLAATDEGLYITYDVGDTWNLLNPILFDQIALPPDFASTQVIYGLHQGGYVGRSDDLGQSWEEVLRVDELSEMALSPDYDDDQTVYAHAPTALWASHDGAESWELRGAHLDIWGAADGLTIVASPDFDADGVLFAAPESNYGVDWILKSSDGARTWRIIHLPLSATRILLTVSPDFAADHTVYASAGNQLYRSTDGGESWAARGALPWNNDMLLLSPDFANDRAIFVVIYGQGIYGSTDEGETWTLWTSSIPAWITDLDFSPGYPADPTVFVSTLDSGMYRSDDGGATWTPLDGPTSTSRFLVALSPAFSQDHTLFVALPDFSGDGAYVYRSEDRGESWTDVSGGVLTDPVTALAVSPGFAQDRTVMVFKTIWYAGPYISEDAGESWFALRGARIPDPHGLGMYGLTATVEDGRLVPLASTPNIDVYRYRWPTVLATSLPRLLALPLELGSTAPVTRPLPLDVSSDGYQAAWEVRESATWLTVTPLSGTLPATVTLAADPTVVEDLVGTAGLPATTEMLLDVYWSLRTSETFTIPVRAFFVHHRIWMPLLLRLQL